LSYAIDLAFNFRQSPESDYKLKTLFATDGRSSKETGDMHYANAANFHVSCSGIGRRTKKDIGADFSADTSQIIGDKRASATD
jgi:hypothetical protein